MRKQREERTIITRSMKNQTRQSRSKREESKKIEIIEKKKYSKKRYPQDKINNTGTHTKILCVSTIQFVKLNDFTENSIVLSKQKYSIPWPSKVLKVEKNRVYVYFFGDKRCGYVNRSEIYDFILSARAIKSKIATHKIQRAYITGLTEVESLLKIPRKHSLFAEVSRKHIDIIFVYCS